MSLIYEKESYAIIGAAQEVHAVLGCGFLEGVYQEALAIEFEKRIIPFEKEKNLEIRYKDHIINKKYVADFICYQKIILETKALNLLNSEHEAQVLNYLKATGLKLGILINFGEKSLKFKRLVF